MSAYRPPLPVSLPPVAGELRVGEVLSAAARVLGRNAPALIALAFLLGLPGAAARLAWPPVGRALQWEQLAVDVPFGAIQSVVLVAAVLPASIGGAATLAGLRKMGRAALGWALCAAAVPVAVAELPMPGVFGSVQPFAALAVQVFLYLAVPVALVERDAGAWAFVRSFQLGAGRRWAILAVILAVTVLVRIPTVPLMRLGWLPPTTIVAALAYAALGALATAGHAAASVAAYRLLVPAGARPDLAEVFE